MSDIQRDYQQYEQYSNSLQLFTARLKTCVETNTEFTMSPTGCLFCTSEDIYATCLTCKATYCETHSNITNLCVKCFNHQYNYQTLDPYSRPDETYDIGYNIYSGYLEDLQQDMQYYLAKYQRMRHVSLTEISYKDCMYCEARDTNYRCETCKIELCYSCMELPWFFICPHCRQNKYGLHFIYDPCQPLEPCCFRYDS